ncbi:MAG: hypothetical protein GWO24_15760, partial [Akkermansiaceae bacterium]|nr:hypothetical protein [Akkermansiaceae bacterium]
MAFAQQNECRFYDAGTGQQLPGGAVGHGDPILDCGFSSDGRYFLTASGDGTARVWEVGTWKQAVADLRHHSRVDDAEFTASGLEVGTASGDHSARLWDRATGLPLTPPLAHPASVLSLDFDPEGRWMVTGCVDGGARIWELPQAPGEVPDWLLDLAELVGGYTITEQERLEQVGGIDKILALKERLENEADDPYVSWGRWFFSDRDGRPVSPSAEVSLAGYRKRVAELDSIADTVSHELLLRWMPSAAPALARSAHKLVSAVQRDGLVDTERADWLSRLATEREPDLVNAWWVRAEVLLAADRREEAARALDQAMALDPEDPNAWLVKALLRRADGSETEARTAFRRAVELAAERENQPPQEGHYLDPLL